MSTRVMLIRRAVFTCWEGDALILKVLLSSGKDSDNCICFHLVMSLLSSFGSFGQGWQTQGPRATCGLRDRRKELLVREFMVVGKESNVRLRDRNHQ